MVIWLDATHALVLAQAARELIERMDNKKELPHPRLLHAIYMAEKQVDEAEDLINEIQDR